MKRSLLRLFSEDPVARLARTNPDFVRRYSAPDQFGFSLETYARWEPFFRFLFEEYFKVKVKGVENIPRDGAAILVGNHSGLLPLDGAMISMAMASNHGSARRIRYLVTDWFFHIPGFSNWVKATGQVRASLSNARQLIEMGEVVGIYPEGIRGVGKPFRERYRVLDFHPGFVQLAIATGTPLIPVSTLGGDEIFPEFTNLKEIAHFLKMPFFPVTLTFPWLPFPLMLIPLPIRWMVHIHKPIKLDYPPEKASDRKLVIKLARQIQYEIQDDLNRMLRQRKLLFTSPEPDQDEQEFSNYKQEKIAEAIDEDE